MTINSTTRKAGPFVGNGTVSAFPFGFKVFQASDLFVVRLNVSAAVEQTLVLNSDYSVTLNPDQNSNPGGVVTLSSALASGYTLTLTSDVPDTQPTDLTNQGGFYPEVINDALDRATIQIQQVQEEIDRTLTAPISTPVGTNLEFPLPSANKFIGWNSTATGLQNLDASSLASIVAFATAYADTFNGNGVTSTFALSYPPGTVRNLDVSINGVTQVPMVDYDISGQALNFTTPPPLGSVVLAKYWQALPNSSGAAQDFTLTPNGYTTAVDVQEGFDDLGSSAGTSKIGFLQTGTGAQARSAQDKLRDTVSVKDFGAVGDGITDDTAAIQACYDACPGFVIDHGNGDTFLITATLNMYTGSIYTGRSAIKAADNALMNSAILLGTSVTDVTVTGLELNGNADNHGANYGVWFNGGARNSVESAYIHDTAQAGIVLQSETESTATGNSLKNCGRANSVAGTPATDNHGIMAYSIGATPCKNITIVNNTIDTAYRKGITTYSAAPGILSSVIINNNVVINCGLGAIYTGNAPGGTPQDGIVICGNVLRNSYANLQLIDLVNSVAANNIINASSSPYGIYIYNSSELTVSGNAIASADRHGIFSDSSSTNERLTISSNTIIKSNAGANPFGAGIYLLDTLNSTVTGNSVFDADGNMTHGIIEGGTANYNVVIGNNVRDASTANYVVIGANTQLLSQSGSLSGVNINTPRATMDVNGGFAVKETALTLVAGANQNVALTNASAQLYVTGLALPFSIGGLTGGVAGRKISIINYTNVAMTLNHNDAGSSAGNRFALAGSANLVVPSLGMVELVYSSQGGGLWFAVG